MVPAAAQSPLTVPYVSIAGGPTVTEGDTASFTLTASPAPSADITVNVNVTDGCNCIAEGQDGPRTVTIGMDGTASLTVTTVDDGTDEPNGLIAVGLYPGSYTVSPPSWATVQVNDDDPPPVGGKPLTRATVTVTSSAGDEAVAEGTEISFTLHFSNLLSAGTTIWYSLRSPRRNVNKSITLEAGITEKTFLRFDTEDNIYNPGGKHKYSVILRNSGSSDLQWVHIGSPSSATATVIDNERVVSIAGGGGVTEGDTATFTLTATPAPVADITVKLDVTDSGSFAGSGQTGSRTVTVGTGGTATLEVTTVDDGTDEPKGAITAVVKSGAGYVLGSPTSAAVTVVDNDPPPPPPPFTVSIAGGSSVTEGGTATFALTASPAPSAAITVNVNVTDSGSFASNGQTGSRTVTVGTSGTATLEVTTVNDNTDEPNGVIGASVRAGDGYGMAVPISATVSVLDDDVAPPSSKPKPVVWFERSTESRREGGWTNFGIRVTPLKSPLRIRVKHGGTATVGSDYNLANGLLNRSDLTIPSYVVGGMNILLKVTDDGVEEGDEIAVITLLPDEAYTVGGLGTYMLTIVDEPAPHVSLSSGGGVMEGKAVKFTLSAVPAPSAPLAVDLKLSQDGDHVAAEDLGWRTVTVPTSGSVTVSIPTVDDDEDEPDGTVTATVGSGDGHYTSGWHHACIWPCLAVDVEDNDRAGVSLSSGSISVSEASGAGNSDSYTVALDSQPTDEVSITVTSGDPAAATVSPSTLRFTPSTWNMPQAVTVRGVDDSVDQRGNRSV
ncbi:MAG: hypothetical protein OXH24_10215, partial [Cyanobacteria bacterium MAG IRC3_bin_20]|nr:hypothetical protein [Cyanobacteria bacterium MAG IRC3_bin_20]